MFVVVDSGTKAKLLCLTGFQEGKLPCKYLGVPVKPQRVTKHECEILVERMILKIRSWLAKKLKYVGRIQHVNSVLMHAMLYWGQMFILPKGVLHKINQVCRAFIWSADSELKRGTLVA